MCRPPSPCLSSPCFSLKAQPLELWDTWWPSLGLPLRALASSCLEPPKETDFHITELFLLGPDIELSSALPHLRYLPNLPSVVIGLLNSPPLDARKFQNQMPVDA